MRSHGLLLRSLVASTLAITGACGDDAATTPDTSVSDTAVADTAVADTGVEDSEAEDTAIADTAVQDTASADSATEVGPTDASAETCGCFSGASCLQAHTASACASLKATCGGGGGLEVVAACDPGLAMASCTRATLTHYFYWARIEGWLAQAQADCDSTLTGSAGTFAVAAIPEAVGAPCSCKRSASACVELHGDACQDLTCDAPEGVQASACSVADRLPGRCVTRDGQRELTFYPPATLALAESSCLGASAVEYYWFPLGL